MNSPSDAGGSSSLPENLRRLPAVSTLLQLLPADRAASSLALDAARQVIREARLQVLGGGAPPALDDLLTQALQVLESSSRRRLRPAINATGVVLNTGLGRAVLASSAVENLVRAARGHSTLEVEVESGRRGSRLAGVSALLRKLVGCEEALVVNNNAAAVFLAIRNLAAGREVVISRGQLVEIGGQFRIPDVIASSGARLVEVGTTNKTHLSDYQRAIRPETALLLHVHPSNFRLLGFASEPPLGQLGALAREQNLPLMADLGSGALLDLGRYGVPGEPTVQQIHAAGVSVCTWSGDKLLGGPQCGIITGSWELLGRMRQDPMMRALRVDKLILAALEATLQLYLEPEQARSEIPTLRAITRPAEAIREAAERVARRIAELIEAASPEAVPGSALQTEVVGTHSQVGGGSLPGEELPSWALSVAATGVSPDTFARSLRLGDPAVFGRITRDRLLLDLRTVALDEEEELARQIVRVWARPLLFAPLPSG